MRNYPLHFFVVFSIFVSSGNAGVVLSASTEGGTSSPARLSYLIIVIVWWTRVQLTIIDRLVQIKESLACWLLIAISVLLHLAGKWGQSEKTLLTVLVGIYRHGQAHCIGVWRRRVGNLGRLRLRLRLRLVLDPLLLVGTGPLLGVHWCILLLLLLCLWGVLRGFNVFSGLWGGLFARARTIWTRTDLRAQTAVLNCINIGVMSALLRPTVITFTPILSLGRQRAGLGVLIHFSWWGTRLWTLKFGFVKGSFLICTKFKFSEPNYKNNQWNNLPLTQTHLVRFRRVDFPSP